MSKLNLKELSLNISEKEYRNLNCYSYSTLSKFVNEGFGKLNTLFDKVESPSLLFGKVFDTLLTDKQNFNNLFVIYDDEHPSEKLLSIVKTIYNNFQVLSLDKLNDDIISNIGIENDYYANSRYDKSRAQKIKDEINEYYLFYANNYGKDIITSEIYNQVIDCVKTILNSNETKHYFLENENCEYFYQLKFKSKYNDIHVKCMIDYIIVDHNNKTIQPIDFKTTSNDEWKFGESYLKYNYYIQSTLYSNILHNTIISDLSNYTILPFKFIVINKDNLKPLIFTDNIDNDIYFYRFGKPINKNYTYQILEELDYYLHNEVDYPKEIEEIRSEDKSINIDQCIKFI
ncbi:MAG: hypothetical protein LBM96_05970 [Methanobrevibacter sp.]|jgi:hypothetical protein|nr:hypothetical protein [Candidatus Methanoflexus mossambicus]